MTLSMIWAQARDGVIGADGRLPWHLPEDLVMFRRLTLDQTVVMGRRTWESLPERFRPLPRRRNVVLTGQPGWQAPGAEVVHSIDEVRERFGDSWVIGGASVYCALLPYAGRVIVTLIDETVTGDTVAPELGAEWVVSGREPPTGWTTSASGLRFAVFDHVREGLAVAGNATSGTAGEPGHN